jgi:hypothetical protein
MIPKGLRVYLAISGVAFALGLLIGFGVHPA